MREKMIEKVVIVLLLVLQIWQIGGSVLVVQAKIEEGDVVFLQGDHECDSLLEYWMEDYQRWSYKIVWYVYYLDQKEGKKYPAFCIEPAKSGVGTGYDSYDGLIKKEKDNRIWRILNKGYMGSSYQDWNLECDDDFYSATKVALHCLADGIAPKDKYILGNRSVDGNTVEEIRRRGAKVLEVSQSLYEYGINGTERYETPKVMIAKRGESREETIGDTSYYVQDYQVTGNKMLQSYEVNIQSFPSGTKVLDSQNQEQTVLSNGLFKMAIPINQIKNNRKGKIEINNAKIKTNPVFYCKSSIPEAQSYVTYTSAYETANTSIELEVRANNCDLQIQKVDKETKQPIPNVMFEIKDEKGVVLEKVITNQKGIAEVKNAYPQMVTIKEIEVPEPYVLAKEEKKVMLEWGKKVSVTFENERKKGELKIRKIDKDNREIMLENVEFELFDSKGKWIKKVVTDKNGEAVISNLELGTYTLRETKTKQGYDLAKDRNIEIKWKEQVVEIVENEKQKGQIEVYKTDAENKKHPLKGVVFEVLNQEEKRVETLITDEKGYAITSKLPIGIYYLKEIKTQSKYRLPQELIKIEIGNKETATVFVANQKQKGRIEIEKVDKENKEIKIANVEFQVLDSEDKVVDTLITNKAGYAITKELPIGKYQIKEIKADEKYVIEEKTIEVEIKDRKIASVEIENEKIKGQIKINKVSAEDNKRNGKPKGSPIQGVEFEIRNEKGEIVQIVTSNEEGIAISKELEKGIYKIREIKGNEDYEITKEEFVIEIVEHKKIEEITITNFPKEPETPKLPKTGF